MTRIELASIMLSERSQSVNDQYHVISFTVKFKKHNTTSKRKKRQIKEPTLFFLSNLYIQSGAQIHNAKIKSHMLYRISQPDALQALNSREQTDGSQSGSGEGKGEMGDRDPGVRQ